MSCSQLLPSWPPQHCNISTGKQTLGEEYVTIVQVDPTKRRIPSRSRRGLLIFLHVFFPYLLNKVLVCLENELEAGGQENRGGSQASRPWSLEGWLRRGAQRAVALLSEPQRKFCLPAVFALQQGLTLLQRLHVAVFYLSGSFYHLSKRAAGISYVSPSNWCLTDCLYCVNALHMKHNFTTTVFLLLCCFLCCCFLINVKCKNLVKYFVALNNLHGEKFRVLLFCNVKTRHSGTSILCKGQLMCSLNVCHCKIQYEIQEILLINYSKIDQKGQFTINERIDR